jgi:protein-L-isoaspartate(D-aspartate) O-methyltransferase
VIVGDGTLGDPSRAPFDRILVTAGAPRVPEPLKRQLVPDDGVMVIPIGPAGHQWLTVVSRHQDRFEESVGEACVFVPLVGEEGWK